jgi:Stress responsive A/B Barrel Domain
MIKHILMYRMKNEATGRTKAENIEICTRALHALKQQIPVVERVEVGRNFARVDNAYDLVVTVELAGRNDFHAFLGHPAHKAAGELISPLRDDWIVVDYEV